MINYFFEDVNPLELDKYIAIWLECIISSEGKKLGKVSYIFCSDDYLLKINKEYLQHDYYTDVITFDYVKGSTISGDIFISLQRIKDNASSLDKSEDEELRRVLAHGILHLCGYKDKTDEEQAAMRAREDFYLKKF